MKSRQNQESAPSKIGRVLQGEERVSVLEPEGAHYQTGGGWEEVWLNCQHRVGGVSKAGGRIHLLRT